MKIDFSDYIGVFVFKDKEDDIDEVVTELARGEG